MLLSEARADFPVWANKRRLFQTWSHFNLSENYWKTEGNGRLKRVSQLAAYWFVRRLDWFLPGSRWGEKSEFNTFPSLLSSYWDCCKIFPFIFHCVCCADWFRHAAFHSQPFKRQIIYSSWFWQHAKPRWFLCERDFSCGNQLFYLFVWIFFVTSNCSAASRPAGFQVFLLWLQASTGSLQEFGIYTLHRFQPILGQSDSGSWAKWLWECRLWQTALQAWLFIFFGQTKINKSAAINLQSLQGLSFLYYLVDLWSFCA